MRKLVRLAAAAILGVCITNVTLAGELQLEGEKAIKLSQADGSILPVASIRFFPKDNATAYEITWDDTRFGEHFLSMRPFKCLESSEKHWCRVPYPYENKRTISAADLTDLEYDLLFVWKGATEYGINLWNGVYYKLTVEGNQLIGRLHEMDMDKLGVPPEAGNLRPIPLATNANHRMIMMKV